MWIKQIELVFIKGELERVVKELSELRYKHQLLLKHLGLAEWEVPAKPSEIKIVTKEEYEKNLAESKPIKSTVREELVNLYSDQLYGQLGSYFNLGRRY